MRKGTFVAIGLLVVFCVLLVWTQNRIIQERSGYRVEEKILMLSDRPEVTRIASLGFRGALADLMWIRSIQYFGGNFSSLNRPEKKNGLINLFNNLFALDPKFKEAYQFAGFVVNESVKDPDLAMDFLLRGAEENPDSWKLPFDAGFIAFYQLNNYEAAKQLFIRAAYGLPYEGVTVESDAGVAEGYEAAAAVDGDSVSTVPFLPGSGALVLDLGEEKVVGRISLEPFTATGQTYRLSYASDPSQSFQVMEGIDRMGFFDFAEPLRTRYVKLDQLQAGTEGENFVLAEVQFRGLRKQDAPSYVDRMAIEMDRNSGRFSAAWNQYLRYYEEAVKKGDEVSAQLALEKLRGIHSNKAVEIISEAVELFREEQGRLPQPDMQDMAQQGYINRIFARKMGEDPMFVEEVAPALFPNGSPFEILTAFGGEEPYLLLTYSGTGDGQEDWYISTRSELLEQQKNQLARLQTYVNKYKEEIGRLPANWDELKQQPWFTETETIFADPLKGEFTIDPQTGEVKAVNPQL